MIMMMVAMTGDTVDIQFWMYMRRSASTVSTSLEKRLRILPRGVVSKNDMGLRRLLANRSACSFREASIHPRATEPDRSNIPIAARD